MRGKHHGRWLAVLVLMAGCASEECLPPPEADATPPALRLTVTYTDAVTGAQTTHTLADTSAAQTLYVQPGTPVEVTYAGEDPEGMRRVQLGATYVQLTVAGVVRRSPAIAPVKASCPQAVLSGTWSVPALAKEQALLLGVAGENWAGQPAGTPSLRLEPGPPPERP
ncbi:MAG: hypothetical protein KatS3mg042_0829 [Rhodothermaceae bacterium]|nr:MAG: hypothetical protein KatS3mg042_0829 [Rhodothermaceae bacterium]